LKSSDTKLKNILSLEPRTYANSRYKSCNVFILKSQSTHSTDTKKITLHNYQILIGRVRHKPGSVSGVLATTLAVIYLGYLLPNTSCGTHLSAIA